MTPLTHRIQKLENVREGALRIIFRKDLRKELKARPRKKGEVIIVLPAYADKL